MKTIDRIGIGDHIAHLAAVSLRRTSDTISGSVSTAMGETTT